VKLWVDDLRKPPDDGWYWALDAEDAKEVLLEHQISEQSLDHDLGDAKSDGLTLLVWEHDHKLVPYLTTLHTWNRIGAERMAAFLADHRYNVVIEPDRRPPTTE